MNKGQLKVHSENIFPIIKKFLYSDHEIFLRELVSNAVDATQKLKTLARLGEFKGELGDLRIEVELDKKAKTITIKDKGIGMTKEEVEKYITQIAFSGAEEFIQKYKDKLDQQAIIGHFGLGFYSAFMVASKVEIYTLSYKPDAKAVHWVCDGSPEYEIEEISNRTIRGTNVVLHIAPDSEEFLDEARIEGILKKYCRFLPVEIQFGKKKDWIKPEPKEGQKPEDVKYEEVEVDNIINNPNPAWTRKPTELSEEDYKKFYQELYPNSFDEPLFHIHLNVDYPFNLTGILYFPKLSNRLEVPKDKIQLYCNQVFVTDNVEQIVPDFLILLRGVIDSPDIPLNVSRSYLQSDANVKKISSHITKKVADKLEEIFKTDRDALIKKWDDIKLFVQYGMVSDDKFHERAIKFFLFKDINGNYYTWDEWFEKIKNLQTNKHGVCTVLYALDPEQQHTYISAARNKGYEILLMNSVLDTHFIQHLERKIDKIVFKRVDSDSPEKLVEKDESVASKLNEEEKNNLKKWFEEILNKETYLVEVEALSEHDAPVMITRPEFTRRMKDMNSIGAGGGMPWMNGLPEIFNVKVNSNHPVYWKLLDEKDENRRKEKIRQLSDLALLSQGLLKGEALTEFMNRNIQMLMN
ncbi:MAG: molecular chaperone HtpG [Bacteroidia bacterium]|nr:molecular chaperone HtpG [Bacteroidia bacterium]